MSWITPIKNTFIKFIVKGKNSGSGGGIDEDALNAKLAQFYVTTETKILNLVNQQLSNYVLKTNFNALETKVNTNTTNITTNTNDITSLKQRVSTLEATPIGGSSLELVNLKIPISVLQNDATYGNMWETLWDNKLIQCPLYSLPKNDFFLNIAGFLQEKVIISIVKAEYDYGDTLGTQPFYNKYILYSTLLNYDTAVFQGNIFFGAYTQSKPYTPKNTDFLFLSLMVSNKPKSTTQSTQNGVTITRGGV